MADYLFNFPNGSVSGLDQVASSLVTEIPVLVPLSLLAIYGIIVISGSLAQSYKRGYVDFALWSMFGIVSVDLVALMMTMASGVIDPITLGICFGFTILNAFWFFLTFGRFEQS